jgi:hypothetical protein
MTAAACIVPLLPDRQPCPDPAATEAGFCAGHLRQAAAELARLEPRQGSDPRPSAVAFADLCGRCGSCRHDTARCDA